MRDLIFVAFLFAFIGVGFRRPFLFVLCFCYVDIVAPQRLSYFLINALPVSLIVMTILDELLIHRKEKPVLPG